MGGRQLNFKRDGLFLRTSKRSSAGDNAGVSKEAQEAAAAAAATAAALAVDKEFSRQSRQVFGSMNRFG